MTVYITILKVLPIIKVLIITLTMLNLSKDTRQIAIENGVDNPFSVDIVPGPLDFTRRDNYRW
jgi:hypothetical protein